MTRLMTRLALTALATTCSSAAPAQATIQADPALPAAEDANAIIVTAQKREQRIEDVPVTVTALTGARMAQIGVSELDEVAAFVPGLQVQEQSANNPGFVIRGITSDSGSAQQGARVTLYYNGVDISRSRGAWQDLYDLERIEVVKGPAGDAVRHRRRGRRGQHRLRPAQGGDQRGNRRKLRQFQPHAGVGLPQRGQRHARRPPRLRLQISRRLCPQHRRRSQGAQPEPGAGRSDDLNGQDQRGLRGSLRWRPTDRITADLVLTYDGQRNPGTAFKSRAFAPTGGQTGDYGYAELSGSPFSATVLGKRKLGLDRNVYDANLTVTAELAPGVTFTTVNGYRRFDALETFDADGGPAWYLEFAEDAKGDQWNHESRFAFDGPRYRAAFGWNAFLENGFQRVPFSTEEGTYLACSVAGAYAGIRAALNQAGIPTGTACVAANGTIPATRATAILTRGRASVLPYAAEFANYGTNAAYSVFADATWIPVPALELTAGARILIEQRRSGYTSTQPDSQILAGLGVFTSLLGVANTKGAKYEAEDSFAAILPRFNALVRLTDTFNLYGTISKGRRSPVVQLAATRVAASSVANAGSIPNRQIVPEEKVWNYEAGIKGRVGAFTGAASVFYQTYDGFQVTVTENGVATTRSAGSANNLGVELEGNLAFGDTLSLFGSFGYIDGGIGKDARNGVFAGNRFRLQPEVTAAGGATLRLPLTGRAAFYATPSVTYRSKVYFELPNSEAIAQGGYTLVNLRAGVDVDNGRYTIGGFARNLTDKRYLIDAGNTGGGFGVPTYIAGEPRFYGIELGARF
ncbi:MAG: TonB-dependent receptor [Sphingomonas taxi]